MALGRLRSIEALRYYAPGEWGKLLGLDRALRTLRIKLKHLADQEGGTTTNGMCQEVDIRYVVTSPKGSAEHLYEGVCCQRGQMENLIKLHKAQMASDRMSCHSATANQVRLILHTAAYCARRHG